MVIQYVRNGRPFIFDSEDWAVVNTRKWFVDQNGYVQAFRKMTNWVLQNHQYLHRLIIGVNDPDQFVDHKNRIKTDNRRANLRLASKSQNSINKPSVSVSGYNGVSYVNKNKKLICARIFCLGKRYYLGMFKTEEAAALAYNEAAKKLHGEFAVLNVIKEKP